MMALPSGFSPFVEFSHESQQWRWIGKRQLLSKVFVEVDVEVFQVRMMLDLCCRSHSGYRERYQRTLSAMAGLERSSR